MKNEEIKDYAFFDLDGTITNSELNNTFDFIDHYYVFNKCRKRLIKRCVLTLISKYLPMKMSKKRKILLKTFFKGINIKELEKYCISYYLPIFDMYTNKEVLTSISRERVKEKSIVLLTACTEIHASIIAKELGFDECIYTSFRTENGIIKDIKEDTFANLKINALRRRGYEDILERSVYYTDETGLEN